MWKSAKTPPKNTDFGWSRDVVVMTNHGDVFVLAHYHGPDGDTWQRTDRFNPGEKVEYWIELPSGILQQEIDMGSMKGKQPKIDAALGRLADMVPGGNLLAGADPVGFLDTVAAELRDLRDENVKLKGTVSIKQDRVNDLEEALRDTLRQLEKAINGNAMDGDWIMAELHGRECLYSQA